MFSLQIADRIVRSGLPLSAVRLVDRGDKVATARLGQPRHRSAGSRLREPVVNAASLTRRVAGGATLIIEELEVFSAEVAGFARRLRAETGYRTYCAAFVTPTQARGVAPHYDTASVFIRQVHGAKRWRVSAPVVRWPTREPEPGAALDSELVLDVTLHEGDCLYVPRGFVHVGDTARQASVHLSVGLRPPTWTSVLGKLLAAAAEEDEQLREAVPPSFAEVDRDALFHERVQALAQCLSQLKPVDAAMAALPAAAPTDEPAPALERALTGYGPALGGPDGTHTAKE
ncbi:MAG TPA: cupin domain-containing protein [Micromonosporaceae bacterium]|nr:cupin domain-containing protein [Micromonosporaceae bacterium]